MCVAGELGSPLFVIAGMSLEFAFSSPVPDGGPVVISGPSGITTVPAPALIDASAYDGLQFWLWVSPATAAAVSSSLVVELVDRNQLLGGGVCDSDASLGTACGFAAADVYGSVAGLAQGAGALLGGGDGGVLTTLSGGWQLVQAPWLSFVSNPGSGGLNEAAVDPTTLAFLNIAVQQYPVPSTGQGSGNISFDFCVYDLSFYR
jgi:hypothetical protein